jgi:uncharacterized protein (DUF433 family)
MATAIDIGTLITQSPEVCDGRPRVAGTGVTVMRIAGCHRLGCNPEEIARKTGLTLAQIHAGLAYYHANQQGIDSDTTTAEAGHTRRTIKMGPAISAPLNEQVRVGNSQECDHASSE